MLRDPTPLDAVDPDIRALIDTRLQELGGIVDDIHEFVTFIVVEAGDTADAVDAALGFPVLTNRFDGTAYGAADFSPSWDVLEEHPSCYELVYCWCRRQSEPGAEVRLSQSMHLKSAAGQELTKRSTGSLQWRHLAHFPASANNLLQSA